MCSHSSSSAPPTPAPAVSVAAPVTTKNTGLDTVKENGNVKAKGKRRLTIPVAANGGTGINV